MYQEYKQVKDRLATVTFTLALKQESPSWGPRTPRIVCKMSVHVCMFGGVGMAFIRA